MHASCLFDVKGPAVVRFVRNASRIQILSWLTANWLRSSIFITQSQVHQRIKVTLKPKKPTRLYDQNSSHPPNITQNEQSSLAANTPSRGEGRSICPINHQRRFFCDIKPSFSPLCLARPSPVGETAQRNQSACGLDGLDSERNSGLASLCTSDSGGIILAIPCEEACGGQIPLRCGVDSRVRVPR